MNKKALLDYALYARKELETQIAVSLNKLGIFKDHVADAHIVGDYCIIDGIQESFPSRVYELRRTIIAIHIDNGNFDDVVEEFAYTWFNRIIAIRFMEVHDYFDHGFRVLTSRDGSYEPEILKNLSYVAKDLMLEEKVIRDFQEQNKTDELFRYVLFKQCNALSGILPLLFDKEGSYLELVLPTNLLSQDSFIRKITDIPEEDFMDDVEVVGWLYQFYNSVKKDAVFASKKTITKETLPAVTQLFTPDWIVRYMADNSIGRIWMESYQDSQLKQELKYYVDDAEQEPDVKKKLEEIKYKNVDPQNISVIEPCCGSGHILVYAFDLLYKMYLEKGYDKKEIPALILGRNLYGLDVDKRAAQLAQFSLIMKAKSIDNRFFKEDRFIKPHVYEILDSQSLTKDYRDLMKKFGFSKESISLAYEIEQLFKNAKVIGSLLKVENADFFKLSSEINEIKSKTEPGLFEQYFYHHDLELLKQLCQLANVMSIKYDVMITNPPYCGYSQLEKAFKEYANINYPRSKSDMFAMFMETNYVKPNGFLSIINMHSWMFLQSFEDFREYLLTNKSIISLLHLGAHAFDSIGGEVVQTVSLVLRKKVDNYISSFIRVVDKQSSDSKKEYFIEQNDNNIKIKKNENDFLKLPGYAILYWLSIGLMNSFDNMKMKDYSTVITGMTTGDNNTFLKLWHEIDYGKIALNYSEMNQIDISKNYWIPYNKGGERRNWFGNNEYVVNWSRKDEFNRPKTTLQHLYLKEGITWPFITSGTFSARFFPCGFLWDVAGSPCFFKNHYDLLYALAFMCSKIADTILKIVNPTVNIQAADIEKLPIIVSEKIKNDLIVLANNNVDIAERDWNSFEKSWNFKAHPFVSSYIENNIVTKNGERSLGNRKINKIEDNYIQFATDCNARFYSLKANEEKINQLLINEYNLGEELTSDVSENEITIYRANKENDIKSFISYLIGLIMGRYSLEQEGLVYAGGKFDKDKYGNYVDEDGIIPIYSYIGINGGLVDEICKLVKTIYGEEYYQENIDFISAALGRRSDESAEETINRYVNDSFYNDHLKTYQKRPIYWMLSSGKMGAFKCLIYLHRYNKDTLGLINSKYFLPRTAMYKAERERLEGRLASGQLDAREKKNVENELDKVIKCQEELLEYGQVLDHLANQYIELDLDDGVKENYVKFQGIKLQVNGATIKKDLLVPFGLEKK